MAGRWDVLWIACGILLAVALAVTIGPLVSGDGYSEQVGLILEPPSKRHWLGTDELGRDVLVRLLYAGRLSLAVGLAAALTAAGVGTAVGMAAGMAGGRVDAFLMRLTDIFLALPALPVLLILAAVDLEKPLSGLQDLLARPDWDLPALAPAPGLHAIRLVLVVALFGWMATARLVRAQVARLRECEFVLAAKACGVGTFRIGVRHLLPHCLGPVLVATSAAVGSNILYEAVLGFLGLGIPPPAPSWGGMLHSARVYSYYRAPWLIYFPGLCITVAVFCVNLIADRLQERANPRQQ